MSEQQPKPGEMHPVDDAFYRLTVQQRDSAWREIERLRGVLELAQDALATWEFSSTGKGVADKLFAASDAVRKVLASTETGSQIGSRKAI